MSATGTPRDPPLAAFGVEQAEELAAYFLSLPQDLRPTAIFSSPYYRCLQTSQPTAKSLELPIYVEHGISEWYSPVSPNSGLHPRPGSASSLQSHFPEINRTTTRNDFTTIEWESMYYPTRKGEDIQALHNRFIEFLVDFIPLVESKLHPQHHRCLLMVSHAAPIISLVRALAGDPHLELRVGCCSLSELDRSSSANDKDKDMAHKAPLAAVRNWIPQKIADGTHMAQGASRDWGIEDVKIADGKVIEHPGEGENGEVDEPVGSQVAAFAVIQTQQPSYL